jgi:hypothetical protein
MDQNHRETDQPSAMGVLVDTDGRGPINPNLKVSFRHRNVVWFQRLASACLRPPLSAFALGFASRYLPWGHLRLRLRFRSPRRPPVQLLPSAPPHAIYGRRGDLRFSFQYFSISAFSIFPSAIFHLPSVILRS